MNKVPSLQYLKLKKFIILSSSIKILAFGQFYALEYSFDDHAFFFILTFICG